jgi:hypothetical protein
VIDPVKLQFGLHGAAGVDVAVPVGVGGDAVSVGCGMGVSVDCGGGEAVGMLVGAGSQLSGKKVFVTILDTCPLVALLAHLK